MVKDFKRAGEDAWLVGLAYDFTEIGWKGISAYANYAQGYVPDSDTTGVGDQKELNLTRDIRPTSFLDGVWLRLRHARVEEDGGAGVDVRQWRVVLNYEVPLL